MSDGMTKKLKTVLLGAALVALSGCLGTEAMPQDPAEREVWLLEQAEAYAPSIESGLRSTSIEDQLITFRGYDISPDEPYVLLSYSVPAEQFGQFAYDSHARPIDMLMMASFELRKAMCKDFQRTDLHANDVQFFVGIDYGEARPFYVAFSDEDCMRYV